MKHFVFLAATLGLLAGCASSPEEAKARRDALIQKSFPDPADQRGLDLVFPLESGGLLKTIEVAYFTAEVSEPEVRRRVAGFCARQNSAHLTGAVTVRKDLGLSTRTLPSGQTKQVRTLFYQCVERG